MNCKFKIIKSETLSEPYLMMSFDEKEKNILSDFLMSMNIDYKDSEYYMNLIDDVTSGKVKSMKLDTEAYWVDVENEKTTIELDYDVTGQNDKIELPTIEFKEALEIWISKLKQFKETGKIE